MSAILQPSIPPIAPAGRAQAVPHGTIGWPEWRDFPVVRQASSKAKPQERAVDDPDPRRNLRKVPYSVPGEADLLLKIRKGELRYQIVADMLEDGLARLMECQAASLLPKEPDTAAARALILDKHRVVVLGARP